jgi:hypothetical protein
MGKCPRCGFFDPYWRADFHDTDREYAKVDDVPESSSWPIGIVLEKDGFAYKRTAKYVRRLPIEIFRARGKWGTPYKNSKYYDPAGASTGPHAKRARASHSSNQKVFT